MSTAFPNADIIDPFGANAFLLGNLPITTVGSEEQPVSSAHAAAREAQDKDIEDPGSLSIDKSPLVLGSSKSFGAPLTLSPSSGRGEKCNCIKCTLNCLKSLHHGSRWVLCPKPNCSYRSWYWYIHMHYGTHFLNSSLCKCDALGCNIACKRWGDLIRHSAIHCTLPKKFPCKELGCKYSGDNGFTRLDKLRSHQKVHQGRAIPQQRPRAIKPRAQDEERAE